MNNSVHKKAKNINRQFTEKCKWVIAKHEKMFYYCYVENTKGEMFLQGRFIYVAKLLKYKMLYVNH